MFSNGWLQDLQRADPIVLGVLYLLVALSFLTWSLIIYKALELWRAGRANRIFAKQFWEATDISIFKEAPPNANGPFALLTSRGLTALQRCEDYGCLSSGSEGEPIGTLTRVLRQAIQDCLTKLEAGTGILATIGNTAPFIGLFGTVIGIMSALKGISQTGAAGLDVVAGPIGEALIATAAGLACAIPAVIAYNSFVRRLRVSGNGLDGFAHDLMVRLLSKRSELHTLESVERK